MSAVAEVEALGLFCNEKRFVIAPQDDFGNIRLDRVMETIHGTASTNLMEVRDLDH